MELRKARGQVEELTQELARVKLDLVEAVVGAEQRRMETRQALLMESQALREVDTARSYITVLEQKVREGGFWAAIKLSLVGRGLGDTSNQCSYIHIYLG